MDIPLQYLLDTSSRKFETEVKVSWYIRFALNILLFIKKRLISDLDNLYVLLRGAKEIVNAYSEDQATKEIILIKKIIARFGSINHLLERANYFDDKDIEEKMNNCIDEMYKIEGVLRIKAFKKKPHIATDINYINALTKISKTSLISHLSNRS